MSISELLNKPIGELAILVGLAVGSVCLLLIVLAVVLDKLNVKKISIVPPRIEFYQEGETRKRRITRRRKSAK